MGHRIVVWAFLLLSPVTTAQVPSDQAAARLQERDVARALATTRPGGELDQLRKSLRDAKDEVKALKAELAKVTAENKSLRATAAKDKPPATQPDVPPVPDPFAGFNEPRLRKGAKIEDASRGLGDPASKEIHSDGSRILVYEKREPGYFRGGTAVEGRLRERTTIIVDGKGIVTDFAVEQQ